jgi:hypothetical protein
MMVEQMLQIRGQRIDDLRHLTFRIDGIAKTGYLSLMAADFYNSANRIGLPNIFPQPWAGVFQCEWSTPLSPH